MRIHRALAAVVCLAALGGTLAPTADGATGKGEGTERRAWVSGAGQAQVSPRQYGVRIQPSLIPMRDGHSLRAVLYLPVGAPVGPCIATLDGYAPPSVVAGAASGGVFAVGMSDYASRGYASVYVHLRTTEAPPEDALYYRYAEDGYDVIEWMAEQSWCNGKVGLDGGSLLGISQWLAAKTIPPHLVAMTPDVACGDCYWDLWYLGGMLPGSGRRNRRPPITGTDEHAAAIRHRNYDSWWRARTTMPADKARIARSGVKMMTLGGWYDYMLGSYTRNYEQYRRAGGEAQFVLGPWAHGDSALGGEPMQPYDYTTAHVMFFDRWLKGVRNGIDKRPRALIWVQGADQWRYEKDWPIADTQRVRYHLRASTSGTSESLNDGSLVFAAPGPRERSVGYRYSPDGPYNSAGAGSALLTEDQRPDEEQSLTWTSPEVSTPTEITGWPKLTFWAAVEGKDADFVVEMTDVAPDGTSTQIARGWLNAQRAFDRTAPKPLTSGAVRRYAIELWPTAYVLDKGHRIRISMSSSDNPGTDPNPNPARVTIHQSAKYPSVLEVPLIGNSALLRSYKEATR